MADCWVVHPDITDQNEIHINKYTGATVLTGTTTLTATTEEQRLIEADASGGAFTVTLPTTSSMIGQILIIVRTSLTGIVTIDADGTETIDGSLTQTLKKQYESVTLYSNGTEWYII